MYPFIHLGGWQLNSYGLCLVAALLAGYGIFRAELHRRSMSAVGPTALMAWLAVGAILGARSLWIIETLFGVPDHPVALEGFSYYGALLFDCVLVLLIARHYRIPALALADALAVPCIAAFAIARMGCFLSGDGDYGIPTAMPWGMSFPHGIVPTLDRVHPAPLYECLTSVAIAIWLWRRGDPRRDAPLPRGTISAEFLILTGVARILVEFIKRNPRLLWGFTEAQFIGSIGIVVGLILLGQRQWHTISR
ncbi:MAG: prolipoprotein diacylglyceryl transferase [Terriglobales bacterium]